MPVRRRVAGWLSSLAGMVAGGRVKIHGSSVHAPWLGGMKLDFSEPWMSALLARLLERLNGTFIDVGVNLGQTLVKVKTIDPHRVYLGFEPNPACVHYVNLLVEKNHFTGVTILPVALGTEPELGRLELFNDDPADSSASVVHGFRKPASVHRVVPVPIFSAATLGEWLPKTTVGVVKIDVEGAEVEVLATLFGLVSRDRPAILIEVLPVYSADNEHRLERQGRLEALIKDLDYGIFRIRKTGQGEFLAVEECDSFGINGDLEACDYLLVGREGSNLVDGLTCS